MYLINNELAKRAEDILYRRTKVRLHMSKQEIDKFKVAFEKLKKVEVKSIQS